MIPYIVFTLPALEHLDLSSNLLASVPEDAPTLSSLRTLDLQGNSITELPASIGGITTVLGPSAKRGVSVY